jgi:Ni/Co efflux regulator RcnB
MIKKILIIVAALYVFGTLAKHQQTDAAQPTNAAREDSARRAAAERARFEASVTRDRINDAFHDFRRDLFRR